MGLILSSSSFFLYNYLTEDSRMVYPGMGSMIMGMESKLCERLSGNATFGNCFGINDICNDVYGIFKYDKKRSEVGCNLNNRVDVSCTKLQLATGWVAQTAHMCYLPFDDELMDSRKDGIWMSSEN